MSKASIKKELGFVMILSFVCALLLGGTRVAIGERAELSDTTVFAVWDILQKNKDAETSYQSFINEFTSLKSSSKLRLWRYNAEPSIVACEATGSGMWNEITAVFVINAMKRQIIGLRITEQNETAGLGSEIASEEFCEQFLLKSFNELEVASVAKLEVDAITGATESSKSVERLLNKALRTILPLSEQSDGSCNGGKNG